MDLLTAMKARCRDRKTKTDFGAHIREVDPRSEIQLCIERPEIKEVGKNSDIQRPGVPFVIFTPVLEQLLTTRTALGQLKIAAHYETLQAHYKCIH